MAAQPLLFVRDVSASQEYAFEHTIDLIAVIDITAGARAEKLDLGLGACHEGHDAPAKN